jgi:AcrR family transcriptional regulator
MPARRSRPRTPRGSLSRDAVVRTALDLMSSEVASQPLTMQRVADALDTRPMSLYSHIENREDLVTAAVDLALQEWTVDVSPRAGWERHVRTWCLSLRDCIRRYPALASELTRNGRCHPVMVHNTAQLLRSLRRAGLKSRSLAHLLRWIPLTVLGAIQLELSRPSDMQTANDEAASIYASIGELSPEDRAEFVDVLPHLDDQSLDDLFAYSIDRLIDGIREIAKKNSA